MTTRKFASEAGFEAYLSLLDVLEEERTVAELDDELNVAKPTIYRYVNMLDELGLVEEAGVQFQGASVTDPRGKSETLWRRTTDEVHFDLEGTIRESPAKYGSGGKTA